MKILLTAVNAKYIHSNPAVNDLKACAGPYEAMVDIAEYTINNPKEQILSDLYRRHPDVIAFSCYIWNIRLIRELLPDLHKVLPETDLWLGGPEVSYDAENEVKELPIRGVMCGPGEGAFRRLLEAYAEGRSAGLPSVMIGELYPLDSIPFWYQDLSGFENRIIYYESSRGCPFRCSYCLSSIDKRMDFRSIDRVQKELSFFLEHKVPQVKFIDRTFNCKKSHAMAIWEYILNHDNGITNFHFEIAADLLDDDMCRLLSQMRPGAVQLEIGVQSTCPETLEAIDRKASFKHISEVVRQIRSWHNIHIHLDLIAGLPYENLERFYESFDDVYRLEPEQLQLGFLKVLKGSPMEERRESYDLLYTSEPPYEVLSTRWLSYGGICELKEVEEVLEQYYNSGQFTETLACLETHYSAPHEFYCALARWYRTHDLFKIQSSRVRRYEILLDFTKHYFPEEELHIRELLTLDLYLRENMKTRPSFAPDPEPWKQTIKDWLYEEARTHTHLPDCASYDYRQMQRQLHGEVFTTLQDSPCLMIFHYEHRDPLTYNAVTYTEAL